MNELQVFNYKNSQLRRVELNGESWWVLKDVCTILSIANATDVAKRLDEDEVTRFNLGGLSGETNIINESGLYNVILRSDKPEAKPFKRWVTHEVLPSIHKTGTYSINNKPGKNLEIKETNARVRLSNQFLKLAKEVDTSSKEYKNILIAKAAEAIAGYQLIPYPKTEQQHYTAEQIGNMFGVSKQKIGRLSNQYQLKTDEYGEWYRNKSQYSNKEVDSFMYNNKAIERFRDILGN